MQKLRKSIKFLRNGQASRASEWTVVKSAQSGSNASNFKYPLHKLIVNEINDPICDKLHLNRRRRVESDRTELKVNQIYTLLQI